MGKIFSGFFRLIGIVIVFAFVWRAVPFIFAIIPLHHDYSGLLILIVITLIILISIFRYHRKAYPIMFASFYIPVGLYMFKDILNPY